MSRSHLVSTASAVAIVASTLALLVGLGSSELWLCDLFANFRIQAGAAVIVLIPIQLLLKRFTLPIASMLVLAPGIYLTYDASPTVRLDSSTQQLNLVSLNLGPRYSNAQLVSDYLTETKADILFLQEFSPAWELALTELAAHYPYSVLVPRPGSYGLAVYSLHPITDSTVGTLVVPRIPLIRASLRINQLSMEVTAVHLLTPVHPRSFRRRNAQIDVIADLANQTGKKAVFCGDWNLTPWSGQYRKIIDAGLTDGLAIDRLKATWPSDLGRLGIPIDHCFVSEGIMIQSKSIGPDVGSDHRPISLEISLFSSIEE